MAQCFQTRETRETQVLLVSLLLEDEMASSYKILSTSYEIKFSKD